MSCRKVEPGGRRVEPGGRRLRESFDADADLVNVYASPPFYSLFDAFAEEGGKLEVEKNDESALCSCDVLSNADKKRQARRVQLWISPYSALLIAGSKIPNLVTRATRVVPRAS